MNAQTPLELLEDLQQRIWIRGDLPFAREATLVVNAALSHSYVRLKFLNALLPTSELDFYIPCNLELVITRDQRELTASVPCEYVLDHVYYDGEFYRYHYSLKNFP